MDVNGREFLGHFYPRSRSRTRWMVEARRGRRGPGQCGAHGGPSGRAILPAHEAGARSGGGGRVRDVWWRQEERRGHPAEHVFQRR